MTVPRPAEALPAPPAHVGRATLLLYLLFFVSGAAALVDEVVWARSLSLVFGGSHLAVSTVLAVYMGGLALGGYLLGGRADATRRPLRLYGLLEVGIGVFALVFLVLLRMYPAVYPPLASIAPENRLYLSLVRVLFAVAAIIVPTTLMGGTLPVLARLAARHPERIGARLSALYGANTLGAVAGTLAAGFVLLRTLGVTTTALAAAAASLLVGLVAMALPEPVDEPAPGAGPREARATAEPGPAAGAEAGSRTLVLWGIGVSGFCALGYEVLWTRMLALVLGTSVYSFAVLLAAFLAGLALGSQTFGLVERRWPRAASLGAFAAVEAAAGLAALGVTLLMRDLPAHATRIQGLLGTGDGDSFAARQGASLLLALAYLLVPAFFLGVAFPMAGAIHARRSRSVGGAVGQVLASNTLGAVLGASASGFVLIFCLGVERSIQVLAVLNVGTGLVIAASRARGRALPWAAAGLTGALLAALATDTGWGRAWDLKYLAVYRNNQRAAFDSPGKTRDALENTDVLYYYEGANETLSVIRPRGGMQALVVNGRPEASTWAADVQCQRTLGHLPMLLHPDPKRVFVLGAGTGMTLAATSLHPEVEHIVLAEIEPGVLGATRTFDTWNHRVLDDPRLRIVINDGRNFLATSRERFDVITADPIHPWSGGAAYLYTREYFRSVAEHLRPGGIATQWLPLYELTVKDIRTVVRTFGESFPYMMIWMTHYDAELVGSRTPLVIDPAALGRRIARPALERDLAEVEMGSAEDFLSYLVTGPAGAAAFGREGAVNTDDNLYLEFSAPESIGNGRLLAENVRALAAVRDGLDPHLVPPGAVEAGPSPVRAQRLLAAGRVYDRAHALFLGAPASADLAALRQALLRDFPDYAPRRFLERLIREAEAGIPTLVASADLPVGGAHGGSRVLRLAAVAMRLGETRAVVVFVDAEKRDLLGQRYFDARPEALDGIVREFATKTMAALVSSHQASAREAQARGLAAPPETATVALLKEELVKAGAPAP